jgi:hypothetical protein
MKTFETASGRGASYQRFAAPEDILVDLTLDGEERRRLLDRWKLELELHADSTDHRTEHDGRTPDALLRRIDACRRLLAEAEDA